MQSTKQAGVFVVVVVYLFFDISFENPEGMKSWVPVLLTQAWPSCQGLQNLTPLEKGQNSPGPIRLREMANPSKGFSVWMLIV